MSVLKLARPIHVPIRQPLLLFPWVHRAMMQEMDGHRSLTLLLLRALDDHDPNRGIFALPPSMSMHTFDELAPIVETEIQERLRRGWRA